MTFKILVAFIVHLIVFAFLTTFTQIGGVLYLFTLFLIRKKQKHRRLKRILFFTTIYISSIFLIVPYIAPVFGRQKIDNNHRVESHHFFTVVSNRNYVTSEMHQVLTDVSFRLQKIDPNLKLIYLDANFPFFDGFPLFPHLSHNDGKKIDLAFIYKNEDGNTTNRKPSNSGYGIFEKPKSDEVDQTKICRQMGAWQYDFPKYLTFGSNNKLRLDEKRTKRLVEFITKNSKVKKVFLEPHLKKRWRLTSNKIRFHGCQAVRHDDHIHVEIK